MSLYEPVKQLSGRVWHLPAHPDQKRVQPNVGLIVGNEETVLVDAGNTPALAEHVVAETRRIAAPPISKVIYTHHHWDHVFGACVYDVEAVAHTLCETLLQKEAARPWSLGYLEAEAERDASLKMVADILGAGVTNWASFKVILPTITFEDSYTLEGAGYRLELRHLGGKHAPDSISVAVEGEGVLFVGDSFYPPPSRLNSPDNTLDTSMLRGFLETGCNLFVDGHSTPFSKAELKEGVQTN